MWDTFEQHFQGDDHDKIWKRINIGIYNGPILYHHILVRQQLKSKYVQLKSVMTDLFVHAKFTTFSCRGFFPFPI